MTQRRILSLPKDLGHAKPNALYQAFGVPVTLTYPDGTRADTRGIWVDQEPFGARREPRLPSHLALAEDAARFIVERQHSVSGAALEAGRDVIEACDSLRGAIVEGRLPDALEHAMAVGLAVARYRRVCQTQRGGHSRALTDVADRVETARRLQQLERRYNASDELQSQHRTLVAYLVHKTGKTDRTIRRYLKRLRRAE